MMRAYIKTYGCTLNQADSETMTSLMNGDGIDVSPVMDGSDVVVVNTCTVKKPTEQRILDLLKKLSREKRRLVVTGCMASANPDLVERAAPGASIVTTSNVHSIAEAVRAAAEGRRVSIDGYTRRDKLQLFAPKESVIAKIPVSEGCLSSCTFCETRFARGPLNSFSEQLILKAVKGSVDMGAKEIQLTAQDAGAYGADRKTDIGALLKKITMIDGDFRVRLGMLNPEHLGKCIDDIIDAMRSDRLYRFIHLPVQSGSDGVLADMGRRCTVGEFYGYVQQLRENVPGITVETDVIVGYPTETRADFEETISMIRMVSPEVTNMSKYGARPHAASSRLEPLPDDVMVERSAELSRVVRAVQRKKNERLIGASMEVRLTERNPKSVNGRNSSYRQVVVRDARHRLRLGGTATAHIYDVSANVLYGRVKDHVLG